MIKVLFVCMGNICRSPTAEGVFTNQVQQEGLSEQIYVDSAGTHNYNIGKAPDLRSQATALQHGIDISQLVARQVIAADLVEFDYILAMDRGNLQILHSLCTSENKHKIHLFLSFASELNVQEVPDPYVGKEGFEYVFNLVETASRGLLAEIS
ncbi:low molecular weight protein-tyrosine-phosphatase [Candidatus Halobeggiatoa sp. HSG11]|nr:low molecular weight protein-tyrosine-phosphatase [Candidatus Halobeggiatoa sp. HSG11]